MCMLRVKFMVPDPYLVKDGLEIQRKVYKHDRWEWKGREGKEVTEFRYKVI